MSGQGVWPSLKFYFRADFGGGLTASFQEVSGLETEAAPIEYRHGNSPVFAPIKLPGLGKVGDVTLRKGIFVNDTKFWTWYDEIKLNTIGKRTMTVSLLDEAGAVKLLWTLTNARPTKLVTTDLKDDSSEVAVEAIEILCDTVAPASPG
jgi:phage tail-like protein